MTRIFVSYDFGSQTDFAVKVAGALVTNGFDVWHDRRTRRSVRRALVRWLGRPDSEIGLDRWIRKGVLGSDLLVLLLSYTRRPGVMPDAWDLVRPGSPAEIITSVNSDVNALIEAYQGKASRAWDDPHRLDQLFHYVVRPIHTFRMAWYEKHAGTPIGKDPFEQWRHWETRLAGALSLPVVAVVLIEPEEDRFADAVAEHYAGGNIRIVVVRHHAMESDLRDRLVPVISRAVPGSNEVAATRDRKRELRRLQRRATTMVVLWICAIMGAIAGLIIGVVAILA